MTKSEQLIFRVTMIDDSATWAGMADDFQGAAEAACAILLAPMRAVKRVELVKVIPLIKNPL